MTNSSTNSLSAVALRIMTVACFVLGGCSGGSSSQPSAEQAKVALAEKVQSASQGRIKLVEFSKTNGIERERAYQLEFTGSIEFTQDCFYGADSAFFCRLSNQIAFPLNRKAGQRDKVTGTLLLEKTENGWRIKDYGVKPVK